MPLLLALVAALIQLRGQPLSGGNLKGSATIRLERASGGDTPVLSLRSPAGPVRLLLDSGASSTMVTPELVQRLGLASRPLASQEVELAGGGSLCAALRPRRTRLPDLDLASDDQQGFLRLNAVEALVLPVAALPRGVDGVLGSVGTAITARVRPAAGIVPASCCMSSLMALSTDRTALRSGTTATKHVKAGQACHHVSKLS
jgi:hypothetical protein